MDKEDGMIWEELREGKNMNKIYCMKKLNYNKQFFKVHYQKKSLSHVILVSDWLQNKIRTAVESSPLRK